MSWKVFGVLLLLLTVKTLFDFFSGSPSSDYANPINYRGMPVDE